MRRTLMVGSEKDFEIKEFLAIRLKSLVYLLHNGSATCFF